MIEENDWRLLNDVQHLMRQCIDPVSGNEIAEHRPEIKTCVFCIDEVNKDLYGTWYVPLDKSCCICEKCFKDFNGMFQWKLLDGWDIEW